MTKVQPLQLCIFSRFRTGLLPCTFLQKTLCGHATFSLFLGALRMTPSLPMSHHRTGPGSRSVWQWQLLRIQFRRQRGCSSADRGREGAGFQEARRRGSAGSLTPTSTHHQSRDSPDSQSVRQHAKQPGSKPGSQVGGGRRPGSKAARQPGN